MAVKTRIDPVSKDIELLISSALSPAAQSVAVAKYAQAQIDAGDAANRRVLGRVPPRTITVDGRPSAPLESVNASHGSIIVEWELVSDVLVWIGDTLKDRSPHVSGDFKDGWTLLADGEVIEAGAQTPNATEFTFVNVVPYARKIEVGKTESGRDFVVQLPNRIAERTARDAQARFGNIARIRSVWISLSNAYTLKNDQASRSFTGGKLRISKKQRHDRVAGSDITYPAILVFLKAK
ncbi:MULTISPECIES: hypothetical protein [unclassified Bradyrhizobium]|uniref:hypothetical protein n=1 Tax=unclassified Bradyrhizobium TaxID=2631580 RepID=UPI001FFAE258|nr:MULTISPECIES: hypothetical protein [unclassified Bradyrhizobium]MCK1676648.1 hypothetical protein [Bradyrhizobium sp. 150]UPJ30309.1 hypothetical protein IVB54_15475 [Bradyrhizobium sp. CW1]